MHKADPYPSPRQLSSPPSAPAHAGPSVRALGLSPSVLTSSFPNSKHWTSSSLLRLGCTLSHSAQTPESRTFSTQACMLLPVGLATHKPPHPLRTRQPLQMRGMQ